MLPDEDSSTVRTTPFLHTFVFCFFVFLPPTRFSDKFVVFVCFLFAMLFFLRKKHKFSRKKKKRVSKWLGSGSEVVRKWFGSGSEMVRKCSEMVRAFVAEFAGKVFYDFPSF